MASSLFVVLIAHMLGDFYLQSDSLSTAKKKSNCALFVHSSIYSLTVTVGLALVDFQVFMSIVAFGVLFGTHSLIDCIKARKLPDTIWAFLVDQVLHIVIALSIALHATIRVSESGFLSFCGGVFGVAECAYVLSAVFLFLLNGKPAAIILQLFLSKFSKHSKIKKSEMRVGRWIGAMERALVVIFILLGQYAVVPFVFAAKSIARFNRLKKQDFSERYLLGTLASFSIALFSALCIRLILLQVFG